MKKLPELVLFFLLLVSVTYAQQVGERFLKTSVVIYNNSGSSKTILLGEPSKLDTFLIKKQEIWQSPVFSTNPQFRITTGHKTKSYQLITGESYMIFWNKKSKCWDLQKARKN